MQKRRAVSDSGRWVSWKPGRQEQEHEDDEGGIWEHIGIYDGDDEPLDEARKVSTSQSRPG